MIIYWRWIPGYRGYYKASTNGKIKSVNRFVKSRGGQRFAQGKILKQITDQDGYKLVSLCKRGKRKLKKVHRLVLETFVGPCLPGMLCRHFPDRNPGNNKISNLSWSSHLENQRDRIFHGTDPKGKRNGRYKHGKRVKI